jgi:uncharacterized protein
MHTASIPATAARWYTQRWPWLLMLGPALVIVAGVITGILAFQRQDAMVVDDYYKRGKTINMDLRRDRVATAMQLSFASGYDPRAGVLSGSLSSYGKGYRAPFRIKLAHATQPGKDIALFVTPDADGRFAASLPRLDAGRWSVVVESAAREWRLTAQWRWPVQAALAIDADKEIAP